METKRKKRHPLRTLLLLLLTMPLAVLLLWAAGHTDAEKRLADMLPLENSWFAPSGLSPAADTAAEEDLLLLVNPWNALPEDCLPELHALSDGTLVAESCYQDLRELLNDCRAAGYAPYICSAYRSRDTQQELFDNKVARLMDAGLSRTAAEAEAATVVARPGTSEHETGLALDIIDSDYTALDQGQEQTGTQQWLMENSWRYGFILRYPPDKSDLTGIIYEPWHYRYVGREAAEEIYRSGLCLEEYLAEST